MPITKSKTFSIGSARFFNIQDEQTFIQICRDYGYVLDNGVHSNWNRPGIYLVFPVEHKILPKNFLKWLPPIKLRFIVSEFKEFLGEFLEE